MNERRKRNGWSWPEEPSGPPTRSGRIAGVAFPVLFLFYLVTPISKVFEEPHSGGVRFLVLLTVVVYGGVYLAVAVPHEWLPKPLRVAAMVTMFACALVLAFVFGPEELVYMTYVIASVLIQAPPRYGLILGLGVTAALLIGTAVADGAADLNAASILVALTIALFGTRRLIMSNAELRAARDEIGALAVAEERARVARDLHDVLGHSLTTITVKAGLARRILESSGDDEKAVAELRDVEHLSRSALSEVRATVSGYRKASLPAEIVGARAALQAAEIAADLPHAVDNVPAELQEPFAYVLREGVTNVIRHAGARRCEVRLGQSWIEIRDDGTGCAHDKSSTTGHGLAGLAERLAQVGGSLTAGPAPAGGFLVRASVTS